MSDKPYPDMEPHGDLRKLADALWQAFVAYRQAGFSEEQAMKLVEKMTDHKPRRK